MNDIRPEIVDFYNAGGEANRLLQGLGRLELARLQELLSRFLPAPPAAVADVGGGPGAHASWLAHQGHVVHLVDPIPLHVEQARERSARQAPHPIASCQIGDARAVPLADQSVDFVCSTARSIT